MKSDSQLRLLIVDDEPAIRRVCATVGRGFNLLCFEAGAGEGAIESLPETRPDIVLADLTLPGLSGMDLLQKIKELLPRTEVVIMSGNNSIELAVDAVRQGAYDYIEKPFRVEKLRQLLNRIAEKVQLVTENQFLRERAMSRVQEPGVAHTHADELSITALEDLERITILRVFEKTGGNKALAGQILGISRATLYRKLKRYNIPMRSVQRQLVGTS
jgi:DNA-binding NtrC family response regulator